MKRIALTFLTLVVIAAAAPRAQDVDKLFKAAMNTELVDGNLQAAIEQYKKVVQTASRALAAQALLRMAECYQKLGDAESRKIYERLVREYADQKESAAMARTRLGTGARRVGQGDIALRKVWTGDNSGRVSRNGRHLTYTESIPGTLRLRDLVSGDDRPLTRRLRDSDGFAGYSAISQDGRQVAYGWCRAGHCELRTVTTQGDDIPPFRRLVFADDIAYITPMDWSPDGNWIAVSLRRADRTGQIGLVSSRDGELRVLKSVDWRGPTRIFFSPDGQVLAYDLTANDSGSERHIYLLAVDGTSELGAVVHASRNVVMGWTSNGRHLLFASDRNGGSMSLWGLTVKGRQPHGPPILATPNIGSSWSLGVATNGTLYMGVSAFHHDIEIAQLDLVTGKQIGSSIKPIQSFSNFEPDWSPDGTHLAYVASREPAPNDLVIAIRSMVTGHVRELRPQLRYYRGLSWAPDGSLVGFGTDMKGREGIFRIDVQTAIITPIVVPTPERLGYEGFFWTPDGNRMFYRTNAGTIRERDLISGGERELNRGAPVGPMTLSPDGKWIAATRRAATGSTSVIVLPTNGGEPHEIWRLTQPQWVNFSMPWTPDGTGVLVRKMLTATTESSELWLVSMTGAPPRRLEIDVNGMATYAGGKMRLHPDGRQLALVSGRASEEVWALENFLPAMSGKH